MLASEQRGLDQADAAIEISNQCAPDRVNTIIDSNCAILSRLLARCEAYGNTKVLAIVKEAFAGGMASHVHLNGHYALPRRRSSHHRLDAIIAGLELK